MSKIADATARPWEVGLERMGDPDKRSIWSISLQVASTKSIWISQEQQEANARLIVQAVNEREPLREMLFRALVELSYVQNVENCEGGLCASAEGKSIIEGGMKLLGVKDLSEDALKGEHNGD